ncbi:hypothetical protein GPN2_10327 [Streptomyces murinus]
MVERRLCMADVRGSTPLGSTVKRARLICGDAGQRGFLGFPAVGGGGCGRRSGGLR